MASANSVSVSLCLVSWFVIKKNAPTVSVSLFLYAVILPNYEIFCFRLQR